MKLIAFFALLVLASCEFDPKTFDWSSVKPITQIKEYRDAFPKFKYVDLDENARIFDRNGRILRGEIVGPTDYPWSVENYLFSFLPLRYFILTIIYRSVGLVISFTWENGWCSASLVSVNFVLSAAQCLLGTETQIAAMLAASDITNVGEFIMITGYTKHHHFNNDLEHDIAVLRLQRPPTLNDRVQLIRLPNLRQQNALFENVKVHVAG